MSEFEIAYLEKLEKIGNGLEHIADMISFFNEKLFFNDKGLFITINNDEPIAISGGLDTNVFINK